MIDVKLREIGYKVMLNDEGDAWYVKCPQTGRQWKLSTRITRGVAQRIYQKLASRMDGFVAKMMLEELKSTEVQDEAPFADFSRSKSE